MEYVVDMQGFRQSGNDFILKELAVAPLLEDDEPLVFLFKEPFPWRRLTDKYKKQNTWLERFHHGIPWSSGLIDYTEIGNIIRAALPDASKIWVQGEVKEKWLKRFNFNIANICDYGYPITDMPKSTTVCTNHNGAYKVTCALHNIKLMKYFYLNHIYMEWEDVSETVEFL